MNTANLKKIAPRARTAFITAIKARAAEFGITAKGHIEPVISGEVLQVAGFTHPASCASALKRLQQRLANDSYETLIEHVAYTWFNRFCAIRFMELKSEEGYLEHGVRLLSHPSQPQGFEVLDRAPEVIDSLISEGVTLNKPALLDLLLAGNEQEALFRELLLGQCHRLHQAMPFLFEAIDDETELLLPTGLTRTDAFWRELVDEIPEPDWQQVEVIGWLYQFYISEKKEQVIGKVVKSADIPAATQLFTPNWIVQYLVQNSVGRHWLQAYPESTLKSVMPYYIEAVKHSTEAITQQGKLTPTSIEPESIRVLDPACGSGHILVEAYNVLYQIYEERGYRSREIPELILRHNLFGLDIDDRAAQLAGFALLMRARQDDKRLFIRDLTLNIHSFKESRHLNINQLWDALNLNVNDAQGHVQDMFIPSKSTQMATDERLLLLIDLHKRFFDAKSFGSLIILPEEKFATINSLRSTLTSLRTTGDAMQKQAANALLPLLSQSVLLANRYDTVVANPPYIGSKWMNSLLKNYIALNYPTSKPDLYAAFIELATYLLKPSAYAGIVAMESWMFLPTFSAFREQMFTKIKMIDLVHMPYEGRGRTSMGINFGTAAFIYSANRNEGYLGNYQCIRFNEIDSHGVPFAFPTINDRSCTRSISDFSSIPGKPLAYWVSDEIIQAFSYKENHISIGTLAEVRKGLATGDNERFIREWHEVNIKDINMDGSEDKSWSKCNNGGDFRKWYGNQGSVIFWKNDGFDIRNFKDESGKLRSRPQGLDKKYLPMVSWTSASASCLGVRYYQSGFISDQNGNFITSTKIQHLYSVLAFLCSTSAKKLTDLLNPTKHILVSNISDLPLPSYFLNSDIVINATMEAIEIAREDWNSIETSIDFRIDPLVSISKASPKTLMSSYSEFKNKWEVKTDRLFEIECLINSLAEKSFDGNSTSEPSIHRSEITLLNNPWFIYKTNNNTSDIDFIFKSKKISNLLEYSVGCMMGRYSLDLEGLVYACAGNEGFKILVERGVYTSFPADSDGILPLTSEAWFEDDIAARVEEFVSTVWGTEHLEENLQFIADSLCLAAIRPVKKGGETSRETIRRYLSTQFFKDHLKTYKKRPIYWLFSSGKEKAFECLVYLHRYNETTLPRMRTEYVTPLLGQMHSRIERLRLQQNEAETAEAKRIGKEIDSLTKQLTELRSFDDQLKHYADMKIPLDLDDGVKINYGKFGTLLAEVKAITGDKAE
ncbi:BREX-1 system adenine-specific DNA-methyltransferase PglX [Leclercia sp. GLN_9]|uniref:BREX-1 system adenine-specific DNA-methyltransferase PglX n=1 Tax=Leclercia sp. GLN_9 TaxID=3367184 RepID=UPI00370A0247